MLTFVSLLYQVWLNRVGDSLGQWMNGRHKLANEQGMIARTRHRQSVVLYLDIRSLKFAFIDINELSTDRLQAVMPQSHSTTGPVRFLAPVPFLARKVEWGARRNFTPVLFSWSHQATGPVRLDTAGYLWFDGIIRRTPHEPRAMPVWASYGPHTRISNVLHILRDSCGTHKGATRHPYGHVRELTQPEFAKIPHGRRVWPYGGGTGPLRSSHGLFTGCSWSLYPCGAVSL